MLDKITKGKQQSPLRIIIYGTEGIGKSSFAAGAPSPVFMGVEDGTSHLDVHRLPMPQSWVDVMVQIDELAKKKHDYRTLVVDTLDAAEPLLWDFVCKRDKQENIDAYGYGKGFNAAVSEWRVFLASVERLQRTTGMNVIMIAHAFVKTFKNPEGEDFDRYQLKLNDKSAGLLKDWASDVLFANYETFATLDKKTKRAKGSDSGARLVYTERRAAYDAKNRHGLPQSLPLSWEAFSAACDQGKPAAISELKDGILRKSKLIGGDIEAAVPASLKKAGENAAMLAQLNNSLNAMMIERNITQ